MNKRKYSGTIVSGYFLFFFLIPIYILPTHEETTNFYGDCPFSIDGLWWKSKTTAEAEKFDYTVEQFADLQILRYRVPGFEDLSSNKKNWFII